MEQGEEEDNERERAGYWERVERIFFMLDPRLAFISASVALDSAEKIKVLENIDVKTVEQEIEIQRLERIRNAAVHPQTGEVIFTPLRLSMIVPVNMMLDFLMLSAKTPLQTVLAQWVNQSYNALHYYANRNTTNQDSFEQRSAAYVASTVGSVSVAVWLKRNKSLGLGMFAPFLAVACADLLNLSIMRKSEFVHGIHVYDNETEKLVGTSQRAGLLSTGSCIIARIAAAFPILAGTPILMRQLDSRTTLFRRHPSLRMPVMICVVGAMIEVAVPLTFGIFRQEMVVKTKYLEPHVQTVEKVYFNKGL